MDLFDLTGFFALEVPTRSLTCPLLKSALCAYGAKQLARVRGCKAIWGGVVSAQARMENWPETGTIDWNYEAAKYYEMAIQELIKSLQRDAGPDNLGDGARTMNGRQESIGSDGRSTCTAPTRRSSDPNSEDTFSATAILAVYEFVSASGFGWHRHLNGAKSLLKIGELKSVPEQQGFASCAYTYPLKLSRSRRAIFWNFARQDYLAGCKSTRGSAGTPKTNAFSHQSEAYLARPSGYRIVERCRATAGRRRTCDSMQSRQPGCNERRYGQ